MFVATERLNLLLQCNMAQRGKGSHMCIIPSNGNCMGKVRVWVYPRVGSGRRHICCGSGMGTGKHHQLWVRVR